MNVTAVFAPKKVDGWSACGVFNGRLNFQFAATARTRASIGDQSHFRLPLSKKKSAE
jgi:hypothetical protein